MQARKGRASYLGERSIGHQDPGATSTALIIARPGTDGREHSLMERVLAGVPASPGTAFGEVRRLDLAGALDMTILDHDVRPAAAARALDALARAAQELEALAERLRVDGRDDEAEILDAGMMMAEDPVLTGAVEAAVLERGLAASSAIVIEVEQIAAQLDALDDADLAARAADVRSLARRAARLSSGDVQGVDQIGSADTILVAADLGPADVDRA